MGITGLWSLLRSTGQPVNLESLGGKVLAVDISMWLHQASKGMRDRHGNPLPNAHLIGLFRRVCKLLYYGIKPVFVFDGGIPLLKKQTLAARRDQRSEAEVRSQQVARQLVTKLLERSAVNQVLHPPSHPSHPSRPSSTPSTPPKGRGGSSGGSGQSTPGEKGSRGRRKGLGDLGKGSGGHRGSLKVAGHSAAVQRDMFELDPLPQSNPGEGASSAHNSDVEWESESESEVESGEGSGDEWDKRLSRRRKIYSEYGDVESMDVESEDFAGLPAEMKHEILTDLKDLRKQNHWAKKGQLPEDSDEFSRFQLARMMKQSRLTRQLDDVRQQLNSTPSQPGSFPHPSGVGAELGPGVTVSRIVSEDDAHYILVSRGGGAVGSRGDARGEFLKALTRKRKAEDEGGSTRIRSTNPNDIFVTAEQTARERQVQRSGVVTGRIDRRFLLKRDRVGIPEAEGGAFSESLDGVTAELENEGESDGELDPRESIQNPAVAGLLSENLVTKAEGSLTNSSEKVEHSGAITSSDHAAGMELAGRELNIERVSRERELAAGLAGVRLPDIARTKRDNFLKADTGTSLVDRNAQYALGEGHAFSVGTKSDHWTGVSNATKNSIDPRTDLMRTDSDMSNVAAGGVGDSEIYSCHTTQHGAVISVASSSLTANEFIGYDDDEETQLRRAIELSLQCTASQQQEQDSALQPRTAIQVHDNVPEHSTLSQHRDKSRESVGERTVNGLHRRDSEGTGMRSLGNERNSEQGAEGEESCDVGQAVLRVEGSDVVEINADSDDSTSSDGESFIEVELGTIPPSSDLPQPSAVCAEIPSMPITLVPDSPAALTRTDLVNLSKVVPETGECSSTLNQSELAARHNQFEGMTRMELAAAEQVLAVEEQELRGERGRQERLATSITDQMHTEAQELLRLFGVPYVVSPMEAEAQCAHLDLTAQTDGSVTDDSDIWAFGGRRVYRHMFNQSEQVELYTAELLQQRLMLDRGALVNLALLCGSDYTDGVSGVGPVTAMEVLAEFSGSGLELLINFRDWWKQAKTWKVAPQETKIKSKLRQLTLSEGFPNPAVADAYLRPTVDESTEAFDWAMPDLDLLRQFASSKLSWTQSQVDELLLPLMKQMNRTDRQSAITSFFPRVLESGSDVLGSKVTSKRVGASLTRLRALAGAQGGGAEGAVRAGQGAKTAKGKATKGLKAKNSTKSVEQVKTAQDIGRSGGFLHNTSHTTLPATARQLELNLSEESSSSADESSSKNINGGATAARKNTPVVDEFEEMSDEVLMSIDLDSITARCATVGELPSTGKEAVASTDGSKMKKLTATKKCKGTGDVGVMRKRR